MTLICQHTLWLHERDATGNCVRLLHECALSQGFESWIVSLNPPRGGYGKEIISPDKINKYINKNNNIYNILHFAGAGYPQSHVRRAGGKKILFYHNITPSYFFTNTGSVSGSGMELAASLVRSRRVLAEFSGEWDAAAGVSRYNLKELRRYGYKKLFYFPLPLNLPAELLKTDESMKNDALSDSPVIGTVGRLAPNKNIESILAVFYFVKKIFPGSSLIIAGSGRDFPEYRQKLLNLGSELGLSLSVRYLENLDDAALYQAYRSMDVFLSLSLHEGFGAPILEAMACSVPVIARDCAAVGETMGGAGVLIKELRPEIVAELVQKILKDRGFRESILEGQKKRVQNYSGISPAARLKELVEFA